MSSSRVEKFNSLLLMFVSDLSATVPGSVALQSARGWLHALVEVDPGNDKVLMVFMKALSGAQDFITRKDAAVFRELDFMPSVLKSDEFWLIFSSLSEADKAICWKYMSRLYRAGLLALEELGVPLDLQQSEQALKRLLDKAPQSGADMKDMQVPDGPIVSTAFAALCRQYAEVVVALRLPGDAAAAWASVEGIVSETDGAGLMTRFNEQYPSAICQQFMSDAPGVVQEYGLPFLDSEFSGDVLARIGAGGDVLARIGAGGDVLARIGAGGEELWSTITQMGTVALTLQSVDDKTLSAVENVARDFLALVQSGEMDLSDVQDDPFKLLEKLASSGVADNLMQMLSDAQ
jgi:hypothetical protein